MLARAHVCAALALLLCACSKGQGQPSGPDEGKICTQIGCINGLQVQIAKATPWQPGAYTFVLDLDDTRVTCTGALPLRPCDAAPTLTCDIPNRVLIGESGCALPPDQHGFSDIHVPAAVERFAVSIIHDGKPLGGIDIKPTYTTSQPNGPGCDPICHSAAASVELP
ncbi:MAG TPA: hypothetical protein VIK91_13585 [Nannocystis sp.]